MSGNRPQLLSRCLDSLLSAEKRAEPIEIEVLVVMNGPQPEALTVLRNRPRIHTILTEATTPAAARNLAIERATGDRLFFLDDDAFIPSRYFDRLALLDHRLGNWDILGGPDRTPPDATIRQKAVGLALQSPFATGPTRHRFISSLPGPVRTDERRLILCNLWVKREFIGSERFDPEFFRNEENVLLKRLQRKSRQVWYDPGLFVYHERRSSWMDLGRALARSGYFRARSILKGFEFKELAYALPALLILSTAWLPILLRYSAIACLPLVVVASSMTLYSVWRCGTPRNWRMAIGILGYQIWIVVCHGTGFWIGLVFGERSRGGIGRPLNRARVVRY